MPWLVEVDQRRRPHRTRYYKCAYHQRLRGSLRKRLAYRNCPYHRGQGNDSWLLLAKNYRKLSQKTIVHLDTGFCCSTINVDIRQRWSRPGSNRQPGCKPQVKRLTSTAPSKDLPPHMLSLAGGSCEAVFFMLGAFRVSPLPQLRAQLFSWASPWLCCCLRRH